MYEPLLAVVLVSALALLLVALMPRHARLPQVVLLLVGGIVIGPEVLDLAAPDDVTLLSDLGMGFLFLLAGYEIKPGIARQPSGQLAAVSWVTSAGVGVLLAAALIALHDLPAGAAMVIALCTTALGILIPILKDEGLMDRPLGVHAVANGAIGELGPIAAMAILLGTRGTLAAVVGLTAFAALSLALAVAPRRFTLARFRGALAPLGDGTGQGALRFTLLLLVALLAGASALGFDAVLGAFLAGMVVRAWAPAESRDFERKLDAVGWGVFIPIFFVSSGMGLEVRAIAETPWLPIELAVVILAVRGGPVLLWYRRHLPRHERHQLAFYTATTLPLLVALTELAVDDGSLDPGLAANVVGAGMVSVLVFPLVARAIGARARRADAEAQVEPTGPSAH